MKKLITVAQVVTKIVNYVKYLKGPDGDTEFRREVNLKSEMPSSSVDKTFEKYGLDVTDIEKVVVKVEEESECLILWYRLEVDPVSLLDFLVVEGKDAGLELILAAED